MAWRFATKHSRFPDSFSTSKLRFGLSGSCGFIPRFIARACRANRPRSPRDDTLASRGRRDKSCLAHRKRQDGSGAPPGDGTAGESLPKSVCGNFHFRPSSLLGERNELFASRGNSRAGLPKRGGNRAIHRHLGPGFVPGQSGQLASTGREYPLRGALLAADYTEIWDTAKIACVCHFVLPCFTMGRSSTIRYLDLALLNGGLVATCGGMA